MSAWLTTSNETTVLICGGATEAATGQRQVDVVKCQRARFVSVSPPPCPPAIAHDLRRHGRPLQIESDQRSYENRHIFHSLSSCINPNNKTICITTTMLSFMQNMPATCERYELVERLYVKQSFTSKRRHRLMSFIGAHQQVPRLAAFYVANLTHNDTESWWRASSRTDVSNRSGIRNIVEERDVRAASVPVSQRDQVWLLKHTLDCVRGTSCELLLMYFVRSRWLTSVAILYSDVAWVSFCKKTLWANFFSTNTYMYAHVLCNGEFTSIFWYMESWCSDGDVFRWHKVWQKVPKYEYTSHSLQSVNTVDSTGIL